MKSWFVHLQHLLIKVFVYVKPMAVRIYYFARIVFTTSDIDELLINYTHASCVQYFDTQWWDLRATDCVVSVDCEHSALSETFDT